MSSPTFRELPPASPESGARKQAGIEFILCTLLLDILGIGLIIPVLPDLVKMLAGKDNSDSSLWFGSLITAYATMQFLFAPLIGALSDRFGRRPVLLTSIAVLTFDFLLTAFAPNLWWLLVARILSGMTAANITAASAYIADISDETTRVRNFGLAGAMLGLGFVLGPLLGGFAGSYSSRLPFLLAALLSAINFLYGWLVLPESLPAHARHWPRRSSFFPGTSLRSLRVEPVVFGLAIAYFCVSFGEMTLRATWILFTEERFHWDAFQNGLALSLVGLMSAFVQAVLLRRLNNRFGERAVLLTGLFISMLAYIGYALATRSEMMFAIIMLSSLGGISGPTAQSIIAKRVDPKTQGQVQGALSSIASLTAILAPPLGTGTFWYFSHAPQSLYFPGIPFVIAAIFAFLALLITAWVTQSISTFHQVTDPIRYSSPAGKI
ncbi:TCR/Tet family MFS transporter [Planctopirus hydrillae]|uniref:Major facilitator superfamily (MFS) profile domain-containing protein n=1 Tax=Planctopirus hydrillae TaxID=1841610 RepID=A0A1C3EHD6_9PLAN|nr:TCR/Tet family MFS transporter [Planctopirus hydrillae]ODA32640.1 hypothetical protein A6X21_20010 [Planctopirus hydrillae]